MLRLATEGQTCSSASRRVCCVVRCSSSNSVIRSSLNVIWDSSDDARFSARFVRCCSSSKAKRAPLNSSFRSSSYKREIVGGMKPRPKRAMPGDRPPLPRPHFSCRAQLLIRAHALPQLGAAALGFQFLRNERSHIGSGVLILWS